MSKTDTISIEEVNGVTGSSFYQLRLICWIILIDEWKGEDRVIVDFYPDGNSSIYETQSMIRSSRWEAEKLCGNNGNSEDYLHLDETFTYNVQEVSLKFQFSIDSDDNNRK